MNLRKMLELMQKHSRDRLLIAARRFAPATARVEGGGRHEPLGAAEHRAGRPPPGPPRRHRASLRSRSSAGRGRRRTSTLTVRAMGARRGAGSLGSSPPRVGCDRGHLHPGGGCRASRASPGGAPLPGRREPGRRGRRHAEGADGATLWGRGARRPAGCTRSSPRGPGWPEGRPTTLAGPGVPRNLLHGGATCEPGELTGCGASCRPRQRWARGPRHRRRGPRVPRGGSGRTGEPAARLGAWPLGGEPQLLGVPREWRWDRRAGAAAPGSCAPLRSRNSAGRGRRRLRSATGDRMTKHGPLGTALSPPPAAPLLLRQGAGAAAGPCRLGPMGGEPPAARGGTPTAVSRFAPAEERAEGGGGLRLRARRVALGHWCSRTGPTEPGAHAGHTARPAERRRACGVPPPRPEASTGGMVARKGREPAAPRRSARACPDEPGALGVAEVERLRRYGPSGRRPASDRGPPGQRAVRHGLKGQARAEGAQGPASPGLGSSRRLRPARPECGGPDRGALHLECGAPPGQPRVPEVRDPAAPWGGQDHGTSQSRPWAGASGAVCPLPWPWRIGEPAWRGSLESSACHRGPAGRTGAWRHAGRCPVVEDARGAPPDEHGSWPGQFSQQPV